MARRALPGIVVLAVVLHAIGIARAVLPAQDGLKFLRVARAFQHQPWVDVIRSSDQHPLYPAAIALAEPVASALIGPGPEAWRIAAQAVSAIASTLLILPLYVFTKSLFGGPTAALAALLLVILPVPAAIGRDTLSDPLALCGFGLALCWGENALRTRHLAPALGCGLAAGLGYWTRPELALLPMLVAGLGLAPSLQKRTRNAALRPDPALPTRPMPALLVTFLAVVGLYALAKGEVSEKLALRRSAATASQHDRQRTAANPLPRGLDDSRWDFAPKEESTRDGPHSLAEAARWAFHAWAEALGGVFAVLAIWGAWKVHAEGPGRGLVALYVAVFSVVLLRHAATLHYLSGRHVLSVVVATLPWAAAGTLAAARAFARRFGPVSISSRGRRAVALGLLIGVCAGFQWRPGHRSRAGHREAGLWLASHARQGDAVLDTRGWAAFVSGLRAYDPWHIPQALSDSRLAYVVIGADELAVTSRRAATWRAVLAYAAEPAATFPATPGRSRPRVCVFRFHPPTSWEGVRP